ncbi:hypothetical protein EJ110_NYTH08770 [Nymphaea thermarum]|nr:hypothetical protein EJ110_NYTH08770 [Nymphaea thermarum]
MDFLSIPAVASSSVSVSSVSATTVDNFVSAKLDGTNYKDWRNQMAAFLVSQGLMGYVNGSISAPPLIISAEVCDSILSSLSELILNPAHTHWQHTDQYVMRVLQTTLHESVLSDVAGFSTSKAVWDALAEMFSGNDKSKGQPLQLRDHLQKMKKDLINGSFSASQMPMCNQDRVRFALDGLEL